MSSRTNQNLPLTLMIRQSAEEEGALLPTAVHMSSPGLGEAEGRAPTAGRGAVGL